MTGLEVFILGLFTNGSYDILKNLFWSSFKRLDWLKDDEQKFTETLKIILEWNESLKKELEDLKENQDKGMNVYNFKKNSNPRGNFWDFWTYNEK